MKTRIKKLILGMLWRKPGVMSAANAVADGTHEQGLLSKLADAALASRYLLVKFGSDGDHVAVADATNAAMGVAYEAPSAADVTNGVPIRVGALGKGPTKLMVASSDASGVIAVGAIVVQAAGGAVKAYTSGAGIRVGIALTASAAAGDVLEVADQVATPVSAAAT